MNYAKESLTFFAIAQTAELVAKRMRTSADREAVITFGVLAELLKEQANKMDKALDEMIAEGKKNG